MTEHDHDHNHSDHGHDGHDHDGPGPAQSGREGQGGPPMDAAAANLARALRMSFRLLSAIMVFVLVLFAFTGVTCIETGQKGVITVLGRQAAVVGPGLHYTWPFPIGDIQKVSAAKQTMEILNFWPQLSPQDMAKADLSKVIPPEKGLRPGWDGALLTGDGYLLHVRLQCVYEVEDPAAYLGGLREPSAAIHAAVCRAAIHAAATRTAEGLMLSEEKGHFTTQVLTNAQESLKQMGAGVRLSQINTVQWTWPIRTLADYEAAQQAATLKNRTIEAAIGQARRILNNAAGPNYRKLVREPWLEPNSPAAAGEAPNNLDLIGQYEIARRDSNASEADRQRLLARIDEVLLDPSTQGDVTAILQGARSDKDAQRSARASRAVTRQSLLDKYRADPDFFLQRKWTEVCGEILRSPTVVKWFLTPAYGKTVIQINTPPEILKEIDRWWGGQPNAPQPSRPSP